MLTFTYELMHGVFLSVATSRPGLRWPDTLRDGPRIHGYMSHVTKSSPAVVSAAAARHPSNAGVTIHEVARLAEVSLMTVSRALNQPHKVAPQTLQRVREAVARTGYVPNLVAGGLRAARSGFVALLVPSLANQHFTGMVRTLIDTLGARGLQVLVGELGYRDTREADLLRTVIGRRPDGIVITGTVHSTQGRALLLNAGIPVVETWDYTDTPVDLLVGASHEDIGARACEFLASRGRKRLAVLGGDGERAERRAQAFTARAAALKLQPPYVHTVAHSSSHADARAALRTMLLQAQPPDAVWCSTDMLAMGVLTEAKMHGIQVPTDLAVMGSGDFDFAATLEPSLTTVYIDSARVGAIAARLLLQRLDGEDMVQKVTDVGFTIVERDST